MVRVTSIQLNEVKKTAVVSLFADAKTDLSSEVEIPDFPDGYDIEFGSSCITADGDIAFMKSNGEWNWVE